MKDWKKVWFYPGPLQIKTLQQVLQENQSPKKFSFFNRSAETGSF